MWFRGGAALGPVGQGPLGYSSVASSSGQITAQISAQVPAGQKTAGAGSYRDTLVVTISY